MSDSKGRGGRGGGRGKPRGGSQGEGRGGQSGRGGNVRGGPQGGRGGPQGSRGGPQGGSQTPRGGHDNPRGHSGQQNRYGSHQDLFPGQNFNPQTSLLGNPTNWQPGVPQTNVPLPPYLPGGVVNYPGQHQIYPGMQPNYPPPNAPGVRAPPMSLPPHQMSLPQQPLTQPPRHDSSAGSAKFESKHPVVKLNDLKPGLKYQDQPTNNDFVCISVEVGGRLFEGYGLTKKDAKKQAAEFALKDLFNIICIEEKGTGNDQGSDEKKGKAKPKSKLKEEGEDMERIFNDTMEDLKKLTLPDVNVKSKRPPTGNRTMQENQGGKPQREKDMGSRGNLKDDTIVDDSQSERGGRRRGGRGKRRGKGTKAGEALPGDDGEEDESGNDSDTSHVSQSSRGRGANRRGRGRGRGRGGLQPSGSTHDLNVRDDSDNESVCSQTSQSGRGRGGRNPRGGRGRGRGGRGANSQRHYSGGQEGDEDEAENKPQQAALDLGDESDENFSEAKVFRYLVKTLGGCASIQKFKEEFSPLPADFDDWIKTPKNRLSVYKQNGRPVVIGPYLRDATVCVDNMGFGGNKKCNRKECNHFHICNFFLNGWCKRGFKCRKGHTFTKGRNRELKTKLGLNPFKDAEIKTIILCRYPQVCPKGKCHKEDCPYLHICYNFLRDKCDDSDCSRGHDLGTPHNLWVLSIYRMEKWPVEKMALLKFLINKPMKPRTKKIQGDTTESTIDPAESVGSVEDEDFEENEYDEDTDDDDDDDDYDDEEDNAEGDKDVVGEVYHYPKFVDSEPKAETLPKKRLDRKNRWNTNEEDSEPIEIAEKVSTNTGVLERDADKKDICPSLIPGSCREKKCDRHHTPIPYLWQIRIFGTWVSFNDEENQKLERSYCNLEEIGDAEVEHEERKYKIHMKFNENIGVVYEIMHGEESLNTNDVLSSRRLSTASFGKEKKPLTTGSFHTQWRWYFSDDVGQWVLFDKDRFQYTLEKKYVMGQKSYLFTRENYKFKYRIEFADWTQVNLDTGKERKILRRPVFVSITDVAAKIYPPIIQVSAPGPVPPGWAPWDLAHPFELVELDESCKEYKEVKGAMFNTLKEDYFTVSNIYRIQNLGLWKEYNIYPMGVVIMTRGSAAPECRYDHAHRVSAHNQQYYMGKKTNMEMDHEMRGESVNVKSLFHGTDSIDTCYGICTNNFDFRLSGKNATMYGKGSYFATTAKYSNCYTRGPLRLMFRARVLIGQYTKGEKDIACPPNIPGEGHKRFDSCVDNETNPSVFVVFDRNQSYPEHLIAYKGKDDELSPALSNPAPVSNPVSRPSSLSSLQTTASGVAQASSSTLGNISQSAQSSPSQLYSGPSSGIGTPQPASSPGVMYSNPYQSSPSSTTSLPGTSRSPSESQSFSYRTASGREQRMSYPEAKKKEDSCSIQ